MRCPLEFPEVCPVDEAECESLAARVLELWSSCGEPVVRDDAIWQEAEHELITERHNRPLIAVLGQTDVTDGEPVRQSRVQVRRS